MTIGYLAAGKCWATAAEATDAHYSAQSSSISAYSNSPGHIILQPYKSGASWYFQRYDCYATACGSYSFAAPSNVYGSCTMEVPASGGTTGLPADFDYTILGALFAFSFSVVVGLWLFGKSAGSIVNIFKPK